jgi:hypothetical protein
MKYKSHGTLMQEVEKFDFQKIDVLSIIKVIARLPHLKKDSENQTWFDISNGRLRTDEIIPEDQDEEFLIDNNYQVIKFFSNNQEFYLEQELNDVFVSVNEQIKQIAGIEYVHLHSMKHFYVEPHTDGNLVLIVNITCPLGQETSNFGFKIGDNCFQPTVGKDIWLDTNLIHSAWNYSNSEWKFLAISIHRDYVN